MGSRYYCPAQNKPLYSYAKLNDKILYMTFLLLSAFHWLSQPQLNHNSTQPKMTEVGFDTKMILYHPLGTQRQQYLSLGQLQLRARVAEPPEYFAYVADLVAEMMISEKVMQEQLKH